MAENNCEDCKTMIKEYGRNSLNDCEVCEHLYPIGQVCICQEEKNINLTEAEVLDLKRGLDALVEKEQDQRDYTDLYTKLNSFYN